MWGRKCGEGSRYCLGCDLCRGDDWLQDHHDDNSWQGVGTQHCQHAGRAVVWPALCEVGGLGVGEGGAAGQGGCWWGKVEANVESTEDIYTERNLLGGV